MKKTLLNPEAKKAILDRIAKLRPDSPAQWGKMNAPQVLCHLADQLRIALGEIKVAGEAGFFGRRVMKSLVMIGMPAPKGKIPTMPEIDQQTAGTKPTDFEKDRQTLYAYIDRFLAKSDDFPYSSHPSFGKLNKREWSRLAWTHMNHHLSQFGV